VHLPSDLAAESLWDSLHDGGLITVKSNLTDRRIFLTFQIEHLRLFHNNRGGAFVFCFSSKTVQSAESPRYAVWPGEYSVPKGVSRDEGIRLIRIPIEVERRIFLWREFEAAFETVPNTIFEVSNADLARHNGRVFTFRLQREMPSTGYHEVYLRAEHLKIQRSDGLPLTKDEFI